MEITISTLHEDLLRLRKEIELMKTLLFYEGELSNWAKRELVKARAEPLSSYTSLEEL
jgi:hypothetical protein